MRQLDLVTGGCGFVGRHLVASLLDRGHDLYIVDDLSTGQSPESFLPMRFVAERTADFGNKRRSYAAPDGQRVSFERADMLHALLEQLQLSAKEDAANAHEDDTRPGEKSPTRWPHFADAYHLASIVGGRHKIDGDPLHVSVDLAIDALFFRWVTQKKGRVGRVLYASSSAAYPIGLQAKDGHVALREDMLVMADGTLGQPDMTYGFSKMTGEYLAHLAASRYGIHVACVRPFSGYGEDQDTVYPVPAIAARVAGGEDPVTVWGTGEQGRDFVHIDDCIEAMLRAIERIGDGSAVNIGTGRLTTFLELAGLFLRLDGRPNTQVRPLVDKPVGVSSRYSDPAQMQARLDFFPQVTLEAGMARVLRAARARLAAKATASTGPRRLERSDRISTATDSSHNAGSAP